LNFKGRTIWITGASSGIGEALAGEFARLGADLILSARNSEKLGLIASELILKHAVRVDVIPVDLSDNSSVDEAIRRVKEMHEKIDFLVNNAGISQRSYVIETPVDVDRKIFEINFFGTITITKALVPLMIQSGGGHIVVMSSIVGKFGIPLRSSYSASKHALHGFFDTLRSELKRKNIKITIICPGRIATDISVHAITKDGSNYGIMDEGQAHGVPVDVFVRRVIRAIRKNRRETVIGGLEITMVYIRRFFPWLYYILASRVKPT